MTEEAFVPKICRREDAPVPEPLQEGINARGQHEGLGRGRGRGGFQRGRGRGGNRPVVHERRYINNIDLPNWFVNPGEIEHELEDEIQHELEEDEGDFGIGDLFEDGEQQEQAINEEAVAEIQLFFEQLEGNHAGDN